MVAGAAAGIGSLAGLLVAFLGAGAVVFVVCGGERGDALLEGVEAGCGQPQGCACR
jgi:hypothetical protein